MNVHPAVWDRNVGGNSPQRTRNVGSTNMEALAEDYRAFDVSVRGGFAWLIEPVEDDVALGDPITRIHVITWKECWGESTDPMHAGMSISLGGSNSVGQAGRIT